MPFQALSISVQKRVGALMSSLKDARKIVEEGNVDQWGRMVEVSDNKGRTVWVFSKVHQLQGLRICKLASVAEGSFMVEEESDEEVSDELSRLLEHDKRIIQPFKEQIELLNLGSEDDVKEVKIGSRLCLDVKKRLIDLLREYSDVFAWSYQDMPSLDSEIVEHRLPLKPECPPVKQKLRRTHPDMAVKIKEEVRKQIDAGFLVTAEYPQ
ncbi:hypothetical protein KIW84_030120 [Lathyrus oleraceus]|uniref:Uncharacterized protein n=1 Tax=Pisum sativum TaxID=3888 RepID=A0A9D4XS55_PEA|nr:hypothetical protein KIW84_030120 [Pisum sativum]